MKKEKYIKNYEKSLYLSIIIAIIGLLLIAYSHFGGNVEGCNRLGVFAIAVAFLSLAMASGAYISEDHNKR